MVEGCRGGVEKKGVVAGGREGRSGDTKPTWLLSATKDGGHVLDAYVIALKLTLENPFVLLSRILHAPVARQNGAER